MPRKPGFYKKGKFFVTSYAGVQHRKLCPIENGEREAEVALARLVVAVDDARRGVGVPSMVSRPAPFPTVVEALDDFLDHVKSETAPATYLWYREKLRTVFSRFSDRAVNELSHKDGLDYKSWLRHEKKWKRYRQKKEKVGLSPSSVNNHLRAAKAWLSWCARPSRRARYGLACSPWEEISYCDEKPRERVLSEEEFAILLANVCHGGAVGAKKDFAEQLTVLRYTTMRPGELRCLRWDYVQFDKHRIVYPSTVIKTRKRRELTMVDRVEEVLKERKTRVESMGVQTAGRYVFPVYSKWNGVRTAGVGEEMQTARCLCHRFRRLVDRCVARGLIVAEKSGERIVPYTTRHTAATRLFEMGHDHATVMFEMGHVNPMTTERYKHLSGSLVGEKIRKKDAEQTA